MGPYPLSHPKGTASGYSPLWGGHVSEAVTHFDTQNRASGSLYRGALCTWCPVPGRLAPSRNWRGHNNNGVTTRYLEKQESRILRPTCCVTSRQVETRSGGSSTGCPNMMCAAR
jgi:hypothetical protein